MFRTAVAFITFAFASGAIQSPPQPYISSGKGSVDWGAGYGIYGGPGEGLGTGGAGVGHGTGGAGVGLGTDGAMSQDYRSFGQNIQGYVPFRGPQVFGYPPQVPASPLIPSGSTYPQGGWNINDWIKLVTPKPPIPKPTSSGQVIVIPEASVEMNTSRQAIGDAPHRPVPDAPFTDDLIPDEPTTDEPATTEPVSTEHATPEPITDEPATIEPITDEPATIEPVTYKPVTYQPDRSVSYEPGRQVTYEPVRPIVPVIPVSTDIPVACRPVSDEPCQEIRPKNKESLTIDLRFLEKVIIELLKALNHIQVPVGLKKKT